MLLGLAAGKIGDLVFYRDGGEQRTRTRVVPNNPRSLAQMAQRVRIANVSAIYRALKPVIADSFPSRRSNQSGFNAFASGAIEISPYLARELALADAVVPAPYVIARGTLTPVPYDINSNSLMTSVMLTVTGLTAEMTTIAAVSEKLLAEYPQLQQGDVLTFVGLDFMPIAGDGTLSGFRASTEIQSLKIDTSNTSALPSDRFAPNTGKLNVNVAFQSEVAAVAMVVSRTDANGALQVSFTELTLTPAASELYAAFRSDEYLNKAVDSYGAGSDSILRD